MSQHKPHNDSVVAAGPPRTGLKLGVLVTLLAVALTAGFFIVQHLKSSRESELVADAQAAADAPPEVSVVAVKYAPSKHLLTLPGEAAAWYQTTIYARVNGYVANWSADIGDRVTKGQSLAMIETPDLDDQLIASQAKLKVSDANVAVAEANAALAKTTYERWRDSPKGIVSDQEREEKKAIYDGSAAQLNAAKSQVNLDQADVDRLTELTRFKVVKAPFDGVITGRRIDIGDLITAGSTANTTSLYTVAQADQMRVFVDVPQNASIGIFAGMPATVTAGESPVRSFEGKVARTSRAINPSSRTLRVEVDVSNPDLALLPGMYLQVGFELSQKTLLQVPASAMLFRSTGPQVAVVEDGKVNFKDVTIATDEGNVIDIASGLSPADKVALNISDQIAQGQRVNAVDSDEAPPAPAAGTTADLMPGH